jgi:tetratricopeptide (TPR) repeat protein
LADGIDAQIIVANMGTLELRAGDLREAERLLKSAVEHERALAGDSAAVAAALGYYGRVLYLTNRIEPALAALREASDMGGRYAGETSPVALQNRLFLGDAQLAAGDVRGAAATLGAAREAALAQYGAAHVLTLRIEHALAQSAAAAGADARPEMQSAVAGLRHLGPSAETSLAQALVALGDVQMKRGELAQAQATLEEAVALREKFPQDRWESAEARERLGEALAMRSGDAADVLKGAARDLETELGAAHPETVRAKNALARLAVKPQPL